MRTHVITGSGEAALPRQLLGAARVGGPLLDLGLAAVLAAIVLVGAATGLRGQPATGTAALLIGAVAVGWRRRWPLAVTAVAIGGYLTDHLLTRHSGPGQPSVLIALYTVAASRERRLALAALGTAAAAVVAGQSVHGPMRASGVAVSLVSLAAAVVLGILIAERRREQERDRRLLADRAAAEERVRIARELHDVVAHHLTVIVVQANVVAEAMADDGPVEPVQAIVESGRRALAEMRRILGVLRAGEADGPERRAPQPGLDQLRAVLDAVRRAGLRVELEIEGDERRLPEALDLSAYRIVQEALTNVMRHTRAMSARVLITYSPRALELQITDDGIDAQATGAGRTGHGLAGMRERAAMFGGQLEAGPIAGQGYRVRAVLPWS